MLRLLYSSVSELNSMNEMDEIASILRTSVARNASSGVTGALIYTGSHFTQALEGDDDQVQDLMRSIAADRRHSQVTVVHRDHATERRFASWQMAYKGLHTDLNQTVSDLIFGLDKGLAVQHMYEVMAQFAPRRTH